MQFPFWSICVIQNAMCPMSTMWGRLSTEAVLQITRGLSHVNHLFYIGMYEDVIFNAGSNFWHYSEIVDERTHKGGQPRAQSEAGVPEVRMSRSKRLPASSNMFANMLAFLANHHHHNHQKASYFHYDAKNTDLTKTNIMTI